jgi:hypothetical protein
MSKVHCFDIDDAKQHGVDKAIILFNLRFWLDKNKANNSNAFDGYYWTYNSASALADLFPYWTANKIQKTLKQMADESLIIVGNYNKIGYDRKKWFTTSEYAIQPIGCIESAKTLNTFSQKAEPIADINTDITTDNKDYVEATPKRAKYLFSDDDLKTAEWMLKKVQLIMPNTKSSNIESWANTVRLMNKVDGKPHSEICAVFNWANKDSFWCKNILSPDKLRKQFDRLSIEVKGKKEIVTPVQTKQNQEANINNELNALFGDN